MDKTVTSDQSNPLIYFDELIQNGGIKRCYDRFKRNEEELTGSSDDNRLEYFLHDRDELGGDIFHKVSFAQDLSNEFRNAYSKTMQLISQYVASKSLNKIRDRIMITLDGICFLHQHTNDINTYGQKELIDKWLLKLIKYIQDKYSSVSVVHPAFTLISKTGVLPTNESEVESIDNIFGFRKGTKMIRTLYDMLVKFKFFDDEVENQYDNFKSVLTSYPDNNNIQLCVACDNGKAAYILRKLEPLFYNLRYSSISSTEIFCNNKGKPFTATDLSKALHYFEKDTDNEDFIDEMGNALKNIL